MLQTVLLTLKYIFRDDLRERAAAGRTIAGSGICLTPNKLLISQKKLAEAEEQAQRYGAALRERYGLTDPRLFAVVGVGVGLERLVWRKASRR
jgi:hypothetical protein